MTGVIRVLLIDDSYVVRSGMKVAIEVLDGIELAGEAENGVQGLQLCEDLHPHVAFVDILMPEMDGITTVKRLQEISPDTQVIVLSGFVDERLLREALDAGATGYLLKTNTIKTLETAIRKAHVGERVMCEEVLQIYQKLFPDVLI